MTPKTAAGEVQVGDRAPAFKAFDEEGKAHALADYADKTLVLYFYPKDDTPGCTLEACSFRDEFAKFMKKGWEILGVSPDGAESHQKFIKKFSLPFPLLVDEDKKICTAYGVWKEKTMYGRKYMGVERSTFLIEKGKIKALWRKVSVSGHSAEILGAA